MPAPDILVAIRHLSNTEDASGSSPTDRLAPTDMFIWAAMSPIEFRTDHHLSDTLALQFFMLRHHLTRRGLRWLGDHL